MNLFIWLISSGAWTMVRIEGVIFAQKYIRWWTTLPTCYLFTVFDMPHTICRIFVIFYIRIEPVNELAKHVWLTLHLKHFQYSKSHILCGKEVNSNEPVISFWNRKFSSAHEVLIFHHVGTHAYIKSRKWDLSFYGKSKIEEK